jgi:tetratricopeptide (TPR) repeat protein
MRNYTWFNSLVLVLALWLFVRASRIRRRSVWVNLVILFVSGVVLSNVTTLLGLQWFSGSLGIDGPILRVLGTYPTIALHYSEVFVVSVLFAICLLGIPQVLLQQREAERGSISLRLLWSFVFCVVYACHYVYFTISFGHIVWLTIAVMALTGSVGALLSLALTPLRERLWTALPQYRLSPRLLWSLFLIVTTILFPFLNDPNGALAYGISYETAEGTVSKEQVEIDNYFNLASYYQSLGDVETALALFKEAIDRQPDFYDAYIHHADLLMQTGQYEAAIVDLDVAVSLAPTNTLAYYARAVAYEALGDYSSAIQNLNHVVALEPDDELAYLARAGFLIYEGEYERALADARRLQERTLAKFMPSLLESVAYIGQQNTEKAQQVLADFLETDEREAYPGGVAFPSLVLTSHTTTYYDLSLQNLSLQASICASDDLLLSVSDKPDAYAENLFLPNVGFQSIGFADLLRKRFSSPAATLEYVTPVVESLAETASSEEAAVVYTTLGSLHASLDWPKTALEYYEQALILASQVSSPDDLAELYYNLGLMNLQEGDIEGGIEYLSKALEIAHYYTEALFARAQAYFDTGRVDEALVDMRRVVQLDPGWTEAQLSLGHYLNLTGEYHSALRELLVIEPDVNDRPIYHHCLGYAYAATGDRSQALAAYEQAFRLTEDLRFSTKVEMYEQIIDELHELEKRESSASAIIEDIWVMMRGVMSVNGALEDSTRTRGIYTASAQPLTATISPTQTTPTSSLTVSPTSPITQILWLQLAAVGPEQIRPGSSDVFEIVAELRRYPDSDGTAFPVELHVGHTYAIEARAQTLNFEVGGETDPEALTRPLEIGRPVRWQWTLSPKQGCEGNQHVIYAIVVYDRDENNWSREIPTNSIKITVPTRYGIPAQILYPISGIGAAAGTFLALPYLNTLLTDWLERRRKRDEDDKGDDDEDSERPRLIVISRDSI